MDCYEVIKTRRSVRAYTSDPIPEDVLHRVLDATRLAPSGRNLQPTRLVLVRDPDRRKDLIPLCNNQKFIAEAPVIIVACGVELPFNRGGYMGRLSMLVEVGIAVDHLTLAARAEGLGTCWIGAFNNDEIKQYLHIPDNCQVVAVIPMGYPAGEPFVEITKRLAIEKVVCEETWGF